MSTTDGERFHIEQIEQLATARVDFLFASTLPAASEAIGIARALAGMSLPYILSFVVHANGTLLDGTELTKVISEIDATASPAPLGYMLNCVHHSNAAAALRCVAEPARQRILGLQANTSARNHAELEGLSTLETEQPHVYANGMWALRSEFQLRILGGCCGTDDRHIRAIACLAAPDAI
jgi:homocysteine S-methyltransferase